MVHTTPCSTSLTARCPQLSLSLDSHKQRQRRWWPNRTSTCLKWNFASKCLFFFLLLLSVLPAPLPANRGLTQLDKWLLRYVSVCVYIVRQILHSNASYVFLTWNSLLQWNFGWFPLHRCTSSSDFVVKWKKKHQQKCWPVPRNTHINGASPLSVFLLLLFFPL